MKILYLYFYNYEDNTFIGVNNKITDQINAFKQLGHECDLQYFKDDYTFINGVKENKCKKGITFYRKDYFKYIKNSKRILEYDIIYVRFPGTIDWNLYKIFNFFKKNNIKVIMEIPTYPIKGEQKQILRKCIKEKRYFAYIKRGLNILIHCIFKEIIHKTECEIVTYMNFDKIWKIKPIIIDNGIDTNRAQIVEKDDTEEINFTIVAAIEKWHGIDRVVEGMKKYVENKDKEKIKINIVGDGNERKNLEDLVKEYGLEKYFKFHGPLKGKELDNIYSKTSIGIASLGLHRIGLDDGSTLKVKEYCSKGIPFIISYKEKLIDDNFKYALKFDANDEPIDIQKCINFYENIKNENYKEEMHKFAVNNYDWKIQFKKVI